MLKVGQKVRIVVPKSDNSLVYTSHSKIGEIIQIIITPTNIFEEEKIKLDVHVKVDQTVHVVSRNWLEVIE